MSMTSLKHSAYDISLFNVACSREQMLVLQTVLNSFRKFKIFPGRYMNVYKVFGWRFSGLWKLCRSSKTAKVQVDFLRHKGRGQQNNLFIVLQLQNLATFS